MAKPDCDDGWFKLAHELDAALAVADFTKGARIVLHEVFSKIYGPAKRKTAALSPSEIGRRTGQQKQNIHRGITELISARALSRQLGGDYRFHKDYESWTWEDGTPRFTKAEIAWIASAPAIAMSYKQSLSPKKIGKASSSPMTHKQSAVINSDDETSSSPMTSCINSDDETSSSPMTFESPPKNPLSGRRQEKGDKEESMRSLATAGNPPVTNSDAEPFDSGQLDPLPPEVRGPGKDAPEALALEEWAMQFGTDRHMEAYSHWARESCALVPAQWLRLLLSHRVLGRSGAKRATVPLLASIVADWRNAGACELERPAMPSPSANGHAEPALLSKVAERDRRLKDLIDLTSPSKSKE